MDEDLNPKNRGLGRGLNALFDDGEDVGSEIVPTDSLLSQKTLPIEFLLPNASQPRQDFEEEALEELASSIRRHGILQPILVRPIENQEDQYEIVAGERRWRAAQKAQLVDVPVVIQNLDDTETLEIALVENLQRENLNPIEEAQGYARLQLEFGYTQDQVADNVGRSRSHVANMLRLLNLPEQIQSHVRSGDITMGHARALLAAEDAEAVLDHVLKDGLSVRETEKLVYGGKGEKEQNDTAVPSSTVNPQNTSAASPKASKDADTLALEKELSDALGMQVRIETGADYQSGHVRVDFKSLDQLDEILARLSNVTDKVRLMN